MGFDGFASPEVPPASSGEPEPSGGDKEKDRSSEDGEIVPPVKLSPVKTEPAAAWAEEIPLNWNRVMVRDELLNVRDFFKQGMTVKVVEEKVRYVRFRVGGSNNTTFLNFSSQFLRSLTCPKSITN